MNQNQTTSQNSHSIAPSSKNITPLGAAATPLVPSPSLPSPVSSPTPAHTSGAERPALRLNISIDRLTTLLPLKPEGRGGLNTKPLASSQKPEEDVKAQAVKDKANPKDKDNKKNKDKDKGKFKKREVHPKTKMKPDEYFAILKSLQEKFPLAFTKGPKLLAVDIHQELLESSELNKTKLRRFMHIYCKSRKYRANYVEGTVRVNLKGEVVGKYDISSEDLKKIIEKQRETKAIAKEKAKERAGADSTKDKALEEGGEAAAIQTEESAKLENKPMPKVQPPKRPELTPTQKKAEQLSFV